MLKAFKIIINGVNFLISFTENIVTP